MPRTQTQASPGLQPATNMDALAASALFTSIWAKSGLLFNSSSWYMISAFLPGSGTTLLIISTTAVNSDANGKMGLTPVE